MDELLFVGLAADTAKTIQAELNL